MIDPVTATIPNHIAAKLSVLDRQMAVAVPPGGNWKDIPETIPSARLEGIRRGYAAGAGSRSTYYGRLHPDRPSYTINTYFTRPGNGCHLHYDYAGGQHRTLSLREAARLQSFPDHFVFQGSRGDIATQIGNAVPPLLAYQIARRLPGPGQFVDLFSGAGGLALGFTWAGWEPIVANDIMLSALATYRANVHDTTVCGDIRHPEVFGAVVERVQHARVGRAHVPLLVLGGPPCQGFSTAGLRRTMDDARNQLFHDYTAMLAALRPLGLTGFVFENVSGLLNMEGGRVFALVRDALHAHAQTLDTWLVRAEAYAVPQRRTRVVLVGGADVGPPLAPPPPVTALERTGTLLEVLPPPPGVRDALADLPPLGDGEDGSHRDYLGPPSTPYQAFMRGAIDAEAYLAGLAQGAEARPGGR